MSKSNFDMALQLIGKKGSCRSDAIAVYLGIEPSEVAPLLQPVVDSGYLVSCAILRPGKPDSAEYRISLAATEGDLLAAPAFVISHGARAEAARSGFKRTPPTRLENRDFKVVEPAKFAPEIEMSRNNVITRQQVLEAIVAAGQGGISPKQLIEQFGCREGNIYNHVSLLSKQTPPVIFKPGTGVICAIQYQQAGGAPKPTGAGKHATREAILDWLTVGKFARAGEIASAIDCSFDSTEAVLRGMYAGMKVDREMDVGHGEYRYFIRTTKLETPHEEPVKAVATAAEKANHETVMAWLEKQPADTGSMPFAIAEAIGCTEDSTRAVLAGLYAGMKVNRQKIGGDWAYFVERDDPDAEPVSPAEATEMLEAIVLAKPEAYPEKEIVLPGGELSIPSLTKVQEIADAAGSLRPIVVEDVLLEDPDAVEFAIFSSGGLDIYCGDATVTLNKAVLGKLRGFLGLFQEAA